MDVKTLVNTLEERLNELLSSRYLSIIDRNNKLINFDYINRLLIEMQSDSGVKASDIRPELEWKLYGRKLKESAKPIYILTPITSSKYIDLQNDAEFVNSDMSPFEINKAIEYNILGVIKSVESLQITDYYDVRDTVPINIDAESNVGKALYKQTSVDILRLFSKITGAHIVKSEVYEYSLEDNTLYVAKGSYENVASQIANALTRFFIFGIQNSRASDVVSIYSNLDTHGKEILHQSIKFVITTFLRIGDYSIEIDVTKIDTSSAIKILNMLDSIMEIIIANSQLSSDAGIASSAYSIERLKKAEALLSMVEAFNASQKIGGNG